jgi:putative redox protein
MMDINEPEPNLVVATWRDDGLAFNLNLPGGHDVTSDEPSPLSGNRGPTPVDLFLGSLAACSGISAVSLFKKMRLEVLSLEIVATGERDTEWPRGFSSIALTFSVVTSPGASRELLHRAVELAVTRYCPVSATITRGNGGCTISHEVNIRDPEPSAPVTPHGNQC